MILAALALSSSFAADPSTVALDDGYRSMYDLNFTAAHEKFASWKRANPDDPMGPVSNAAAYLFSELERLHVLDSELFVNDNKYFQRDRPPADAAVKQAFQQEVSSGRQAVERVLARAPFDRNAMFAQVLTYGLEADYMALIEHRDLPALRTVKTGRTLAVELLKMHPDCYDAYIAIGLENYLLSQKPAPVRWVLNWTGSQTNKEEGLASLRLTAEKGYLLQPYARMLLAVAALRDNDRDHAARILEGLTREFPHNRLYASELARIKGTK